MIYDGIKNWREKTKGLFHITEYERFWNYIANLQEENFKLKAENEKLKAKIVIAGVMDYFKGEDFIKDMEKMDNEQRRTIS